VKIYVAASEALSKKERGDAEKLVWVPIISFCEMSFPFRRLVTP
jgi:hypothetical protein